MNILSKLGTMTKMKLTKKDQAKFILEGVQDRFTELNQVIGPAGSVPMLLAETEYNDQATEIAILVDELNVEIDLLAKDIKEEIN